MYTPCSKNQSNNCHKPLLQIITSDCHPQTSAMANFAWDETVEGFYHDNSQQTCSKNAAEFPLHHTSQRLANKNNQSKSHAAVCQMINPDLGNQQMLNHDHIYSNSFNIIEDMGASMYSATNDRLHLSLPLEDDVQFSMPSTSNNHFNLIDLINGGSQRQTPPNRQEHWNLSDVQSNFRYLD